MSKEHHYNLLLRWTGNTGEGTKTYNSYSRNHTIEINGKPVIHGSSDSAFRGDPMFHTPEDLFLASISSCHMLWYLHLCSNNGVIVVGYKDQPVGTMIENNDGNGRFTEVILRPLVSVSAESMEEVAIELHKKANQFCFIANSCNFPVRHEPICITAKEKI